MTDKQFKDVYEVLSHVQKNLKAPKKRENKFGGYKYRNAEDILDGLKEVLPDGAIVRIEDDVIFCNGRFYIKSEAILRFAGAEVRNASFAREPESKKGSDESQITGAASSYARKYALNGLFMIDDTQDADATNTHGKDEIKNAKTENDVKAGKALGGSIRDGIDDETRLQMYNQALSDIGNCADLDKLKTVWTKIGKGKAVFTEAQWSDLEQAKDEAKTTMAPF